MNLRHEVSNYAEEQKVELPKAEFSHKLIEERVNKFLQVAGMAINRNNAEAKSIASFISTAICELAMMYHPHPLVDIEVGDIAICNYGYHLNGEVSGRYVHSIVCAVEDEMAFVLPITKLCHDDVENLNYLWFANEYDVTYTAPSCKDYPGGSVLLRQGRWVRRERISEVVGYAHPPFMSKIIRILPRTLFFAYDNYVEEAEDEDVDLDIDILDMEIPEIPLLDGEEVKDEEEAAFEVPACLKGNATETMIYQKFGKELLLLDKAPDNERVSGYNLTCFCKALGLPTSSYVLELALCSATCLERVSKITNDAVMETMILDSSFGLSRSEAQKELKEIFKAWILANPDIKEKHPNISMTTIFKLFYKLMKNYK